MAGQSYAFAEQDAHRVARDIVAPPSGAGGLPARPRVRPLTGSGTGGALLDPPSSVSGTLSEPGRPLEPDVRRHFEQRLGRDLSHVRVHAGPSASRSARDVGARAYTVGRDIAFGAGQYAPATPAGRYVLAHELAHVLQQDGLRGGQQGAPLQRLSVSHVVEAGADLVGGPGLAALAREQREFINDLTASVKESPRHVLEFFENDIWEQIQAHWLRITVVTGVLLGAEGIIALLTATPEPALTKVIAAILEIIVIAILGYFAGVEVGGAYEEGRRWLALARQAHGRPEAISEASRAFVRMVWHIVMVVLTIAGIRARLRGIASGGSGGAAADDPAAGGGTAPGDSGAGSGAGDAAGGGKVLPFRRPQLQSPGQSPQPGPSAFGEGGTALKYDPAEAQPAEPLPQPVQQTPPGAAASRAGAVARRRGIQPVPAAAAGMSSADEPARRPPLVLRLPREKEPHLTLYRQWLGTLQSDPAYDRGRPAQRRKWLNAHRIGDSHAIPKEIYDRGHTDGLTGDAGEELIKIPDWTRTGTRPILMQVDHIIELQVTPGRMRDAFDDVNYYELLDKDSNENSGRTLRANVAAERAVQEAFDPSKTNQVLIFDQVELDGGQPGERWTSEQLQQGEQLDAYERIRGIDHP